MQCPSIPGRAARCSPGGAVRGVGAGPGQVLLTLLLPPLKPRPVGARRSAAGGGGGSGKRFSHPAGSPGTSALPPAAQGEWSGLGKLRHGQATALEKRCEPRSPPPHCPPFTPSSRVGGSWGAGNPILPGRRSLPPQDPPPAQTEKKGKVGEVPSETSQGGREGPPPHRARPPLTPPRVSPSPRLALFIYGRTYRKAKQTASPLPRRHRGTPGVT